MSINLNYDHQAVAKIESSGDNLTLSRKIMIISNVTLSLNEIK